MSYAIIRNANYKKDNLAGLYKHNERKNTNNSNKDINKINSIKNYSLKQCNTTYSKAIQNLINENDLKCRITSYTNLVCEFIITSDRDFFKRIGEVETKRYFQTAYNFVANYKGLSEKYILSAKIQCMLVVPFIYSIFQKGRIPKIFQKIMDKRNDTYINKMMAMFGIGSKDMSFVSKMSIYNQFYSDLVTPLDNYIEVTDTNIYVFYALKMGKKYLQRYYQYFKNPIIKEFELQHEELLVCYPEKWCEEIKKIIA